jgi:hypothetical protein
MRSAWPLKLCLNKLLSTGLWAKKHVRLLLEFGPRTAAKFPFMQRYTTDEPKLLTATISKNRAAGLKLERGEREVIVFGYPDESSIHWTVELLHGEESLNRN